MSVVVEYFPIASIKEAGESLLGRGPWNDEVITINKRDLTLNDIEHRILRPIFKDYRVHFAVNCASIGCPNLSVAAFTADNLEPQLQQLTLDYLNHPRGIALEQDRLVLSSIFQWYAVDFAQTEQNLLMVLASYLKPNISKALEQFQGEIEYRYDWRLNGL